MFLDGAALSAEIDRLLADANGFAAAGSYVGAGTLARIVEPSKSLIICDFASAGTNPAAVRDLIEAGVRVLHVQCLHAKLVMAGDVAIVSSANLSTNGLGGECQDSCRTI